jgi:hypothetical protein
VKKFIVLSVILALALFAFSLGIHAQTTAEDQTPTFYRLVPGTYVNEWPRFTIHYPKDWVEGRLRFDSMFQIGAPGPAPRIPSLGVVVSGLGVPLDKFADFCVKFHNASAKDVTLIADKPFRLRDGTPAQEVELQMVMNGRPLSVVYVAAKKDDVLIHMNVTSAIGKVGEDLKAILHSLEFQPGKDEVVKVPPDIQEFLNTYCTDILSHDVARVMTHYSDRYLNSGAKKGEWEQVWKQMIGKVMSVEVSVTGFVPSGDRVYLAGFISSYWGKLPLKRTSIIKENGEWKWYGNQRDVSPYPPPPQR